MKRVKNRGFTLVELVAIVVVLAAIFLVGFPILLGITKKTNDSKFDVMVDNLCEAAKSYVNDHPEKYPNLNVVGNKLVLGISELIEYGIVDPETVNPRTNQTLEDSSIVITVEEDQSLSCTFDSRTVTPIPSSDLICNSDLVYTGELLELIKNKHEGVIYTNDKAINAGSYTVTASLDPNSTFVWEDTTSTSKVVVCTINKAEDNITVVPVSKIYDGNPITPSVETFSGSSIGKSFFSDAVCNSSSQAINVGIYYGIITTPGNSNYNATTSGCKLTGTILPAPLTPTVTCDASKIYDGTRNANCTISLTGKIGSDNVTPSGTCLYDTPDVGTNKTITCTGITIQGSDAFNYTLTSTTATTNGDINNVKLTFDANGGTLSGTSPLYTRKGESGVFTGLTNSTTASYPTASRTGYTFDGWTINNTKVVNANGTLVPSVTNYTDSNGKWLITTNQTLKAKWVAKQLTIRYNKNDGTNATSTETFTYDGNMDDNKFNPPTGYNTRTGYKFAGWSMKADGTDGIRWDFNASVGDNWFVNQMGDATTKTVDVYAIWTTNKLTMILNANGATKNGSTTLTSQTLGSYTYNYDQNFDATSGLWNYDGTGSFSLIKTGYYATGYWHVNSATSTTKVHQNTGLPKITDVAQAFGVLDDLKTQDVTVTLYAGWTPNVLTVNYYANGATKDSSGNTVNELLKTETLNYDGTVGYQWPTDYADPYGFKLVRPGYTKDGKYHIGSGTSTTTIPQDLVTNTNGTTVISVAQSLGALSSLESGNTTVNIYAGWTVNTYTITYNLNCNGSSSCSGKPADQTYTYAPGQSINLSSTTPTRTAFTFKGWSLDPNASNGTYSPGQAWGRQSIPSSGTVYTLYAIWESSERPTVTCSVSGTSATGTGTTKQAGYLVGATVTCTCTGENAKPTSMTIDGSTVTTTSSNNGYTRSASKTISSPGAINVSATCTNEGQSQNTGSTGTKYYYRKFQLIFNRNGASSISSTGGTQYLMANSTTGDGGHSYSSTITRNTDCGSACGVVGWEWSSSAATTARLNSASTINLCWNGTSGCSYSVASNKNSGTLNVTGAFNLYAISYGTISGLPQTRSASGGWAKGYYPTDANQPYLNTDNTSQVIVDSEASVRVFNTRRSAYAITQGVCAWVWGGNQPDGTFESQVHASGAVLKYGTDLTFDETRGNNPSGFSAIPIGVYNNDGWWCQSHGTGWTLTIYPYGGTYNGTTGNTTRTMQYGSRDNNSIGVPTRTGYTFTGWYNDPDLGTQVFNSSGNATGNYWYYPGSSNNLAIWVHYGSNVNVWARWTINKNTLTVNPNGGSVVFNGATRTSSSSATQNYNTTISVPNPTRSATTVDDGTITITYDEHGGTTVSDATLTKKKTTAYGFTGWTNSGTCGGMSGTTYTFPSNNGTTCTKTAGWSETYNNFTSPTSITLPSISRTGYTFAGWYTAASGGTRVGAYPTAISPTASATYHAHWTAKTYTVTFNPNYTTGSGQYQSPVPSFSKTMTYGSTSNNSVPITGYTRTGYTFLGWYTAASGGTQIFNSSGAAIANTTYWNASKQWKYDGTVTFYAHWSKN